MKIFRGATCWGAILAALLTTCFVLQASPATGATYYVSPFGSNQAPYTNWSTAATTIQVAIDEATDGDTVLVGDGFYDTGGRVLHGSLANRIAVTNAVTVRGMGFAYIYGSGPSGDTAVRCAYLGDGARLEGLTLFNGHTRTIDDAPLETRGGGVFCEPTAVVSNCYIYLNAAIIGGGTWDGVIQDCRIYQNSAVVGGGTAYGEIRNCAVYQNVASNAGGGSFEGDLRNCLVYGNSARTGGGTYEGDLRNCTISRNTATSFGKGTSFGTFHNCIIYGNVEPIGYAETYGGTFSYTCCGYMYPLPGDGNITNDPQFVDASLQDYHLLPSSPCINAGTNQAWMIGAVDLDGQPRIREEIVDMGAYEMPLLGPAITRLVPLPSTDGWVLTWTSVSNHDYAVYCTSETNFEFNILLQDHLPAEPPLNTYTDTVNGVATRCYRVETGP